MNSRRAHDEGRAPESPRAGFAYAFPGVPGTGTHYHILVPDEGAPTAGLAGGTTERCLALRIYRAKRAADGAVAVRDALAGKGAAPAILDPVSAGGCGDSFGLAVPGSGLRTPPPVRVVRVSLDAGDLPAAEKRLAAVPGLERLLAKRLGGAEAGEVVLDVHVVGGE